MTDFKTAVAEVKLAYDIVDYIQQSGVRLKQAGANKYKGLCPFHNEKTGSFTVDAHFQNYKCFGCGVSGDLIKFVQSYEHLEFFDSLKKLAEDKNIQLDIKEERSGIDYSSLREAMRTISNFYVSEYRKLPATHPARLEVRNRKLSEKKMLYGYAPENRTSLYRHLKAQGFTDELILLTGACIQFEGKKDMFDFWNGRLMFFFTDVSGKPLGWSGRKLYETDTRGKYVNSKDGPLFDKSAVLYNIFQAKKKAAETKSVYVAEGQFDVASFVEVGLENAVAASGTAFTEKQALILRRLVSEEGKIIFCFDGDSAGKKAAESVFKHIPSIHAQAWAVSLPDGDDPDTYRQTHGSEALVAYMEGNRVPLVEFVLDNAAEAFDLQSEIEKTQYIGVAARILRTISSNVLRETYTKRVSLDSFTSIEVIRQAINDAESLTVERPSARSEEPVESDEAEAVEETQETSAFSVHDLKVRVAQDEQYDVSARILALAFSESTLVDVLADRASLLPSEFSLMVQEFQELAPEGRLIPEKFVESELVEYLITSEFFPFVHLMDPKAKTLQLTYLLDRLELLVNQKRERAVRLKVARVLHSSPNQGAEFLAKALEAEERGLQETAVRDSKPSQREEAQV